MEQGMGGCRFFTLAPGTATGVGFLAFAVVGVATVFACIPILPFLVGEKLQTLFVRVESTFKFIDLQLLNPKSHNPF
jgi:hypothetical protein